MKNEPTLSAGNKNLTITKRVVMFRVGHVTYMGAPAIEEAKIRGALPKNIRTELQALAYATGYQDGYFRGVRDVQAIRGRVRSQPEGVTIPDEFKDDGVGERYMDGNAAGYQRATGSRLQEGMVEDAEKVMDAIEAGELT